MLINDVSENVVLHSITTVDCAVGVGASLGASSRDENKLHLSTIRDCKLYGESPIDDCPDEEND